MHKDQIARFARQIALPQINLRGQKRLADSHVLIAGLGGLGSAAALYLANSGIGRLTLNDFDRVDVTNLPRQILFDERDIDTFKTTATAGRLRQYNSEIHIEELNRRLSAAELLAAVTDCDVALDCMDNFSARGAINRACFKAGRPLVTGAAIRLEGQLAVFRHDARRDENLPKNPCYNCLYTEQDENLENCAGQGILGSVVGTIGCMMATEAIKLLAGLESSLDGKLWVYDALGGTTKTIGIKPREDCPVCGSKGSDPKGA
jgi:molybdopterin/thiamine biosynthesis adenylyltransferase